MKVRHVYAKSGEYVRVHREHEQDDGLDLGLIITLIVIGFAAVMILWKLMPMLMILCFLGVIFGGGGKRRR